jgi:hypothetical protein
LRLFLDNQIDEKIFIDSELEECSMAHPCDDKKMMKDNER